jgi:hypothetical protein
MNDAVVTAHLLRARGEFLEMPGLRLTTRQAARLWSLDGEICRAILTHLAASGFLGQTSDGAFVLRTSR